MLFIFIISLYSAFGYTINQINVIPSSSEQGSPFQFCADISSSDSTMQMISEVQMPDTSFRKYQMQGTPASEIKQSTCFDSLIGDYEFKYTFLDSLQTGDYAVNFIGFDSDGGKQEISKFKVTSKIIQQVQQVSKVINQTGMFVGGTEYQVGDTGKIFVQLEEGGTAINTANCYLTSYYPNNSLFLNSISLIYLAGSDGLYYYSAIVPNATGVFMNIARCQYSVDNQYFYSPDYSPYLDELSNLTTNLGQVHPEHGNFHAVNRIGDDDYVAIDSTTTLFSTKFTNQTYRFNLSKSPTNITNISEITIFLSGQSSENAFLQSWIYNYNLSQFELISNTFQFSGGASTTQPQTDNELFSYHITNTQNYTRGNIIDLEFVTTDGTSHTLWIDWIDVKISGFQTSVSEVRGSSEWHVTTHLIETKNLAQAILDFLTTDIWNKLLEILGVTQTNQAILNNTQDKITNLSGQLSATNQSIIDAINNLNVSIGSVNVTINGSTLATHNDIIALNDSINNQFQDMVFGESYG